MYTRVSVFIPNGVKLENKMLVKLRTFVSGQVICIQGFVILYA